MRRGNITGILILGGTLLGLLLAVITLYLQVREPDEGCQVMEAPTFQYEGNSPVCAMPRPSWEQEVEKKCGALGFDGYDLRDAECSDGALEYECLTVTKVCS